MQQRIGGSHPSERKEPGRTHTHTDLELNAVAYSRQPIISINIDSIISNIDSRYRFIRLLILLS